MLKLISSSITALICSLASLNGMSYAAAKASRTLASNPAAALADLAFGEKFCNEVVDPLQMGSHHWLACMAEVERLVATRLSRSELVVRTCEAIRDTFSVAGSLEACREGGARLVFSESFGEAQKALFARTASSIIACYEAFGVVQPFYDETGRCADDSDVSAWNLTARARMTTSLQAYTGSVEPSATAGTYRGDVSFYNLAGQRCGFELIFDYSGEDITANTSHFACR